MTKNTKTNNNAPFCTLYKNKKYKKIFLIKKPTKKVVSMLCTITYFSYMVVVVAHNIQVDLVEVAHIVLAEVEHI